MNRAIFLDRDGTLNSDSRDYIKDLSDFRMFSFTPQALKILQKLGFKLILITNQSAIARGLTTQDEVEKIHEFLKKELLKSGVILDGIYLCPHHPDDNCLCRKPKTGNIFKAVNDFKIDTSKSYFIGDSEKDIETGAQAGCKTVLVQTGIDKKEETMNWRIAPDYIVEDLLYAAKLIEEMESQ